MLAINVKTSAAVMYPSNDLEHTLKFDINCCQLPENHAFYVLLDAGDYTKISAGISLNFVRIEKLFLSLYIAILTKFDF